MPYSYPSDGRIRSRLASNHRTRLQWGLAWGLSAATVCSGIAAAFAVLQHRTYFPQYGLGLGKIVAAYYIAGVLCGLLLGVAYPLIATRWGAVLVGFLLGTIAYGVVAVALVGLRPLALGAAVIPGVLIGGGLGLVAFDESHDRAE